MESETKLSQIDWDLVHRISHTTPNYFLKTSKQYPKLSKIDIKIERMSGLSNIIYKLSPKETKSSPIAFRPLIYRIYNQMFECFISREQENQICKVIEDNEMGPRVLFMNSKLRIEEFLMNQITLSTDEIRDNEALLLEFIPKEIAKFHFVLTENFKKLKNEKKAKIYKILHEIQYKKLIETAINECNSSEENKEILNNILNTIFSDNYQNQLKKQLNLLEQLSDNKLVFCHNDLNNTNIFFKHDGKKLCLIDYEYADWNFLGLEFANFFNEISTNYNYKQRPYFKIELEKYPAMETRKKFYSAYYKALKNLELNQQDEESLEDKINSLDKQVQTARIFSHYFWMVIGFLSLNFADFNNDAFDLVEYIKQRFMLINSILEIDCIKQS